MNNQKVIKGQLRVNPRRRAKPVLVYGPSGMPQASVEALAAAAGRKAKTAGRKPNDQRIAHYEAQNGRALQLTPRQAKRVRKHLNRATGGDEAAHRPARLLGAPMDPAETQALARQMGDRGELS